MDNVALPLGHLKPRRHSEWGGVHLRGGGWRGQKGRTVIGTGGDKRGGRIVGTGVVGTVRVCTMSRERGDRTGAANAMAPLATAITARTSAAGLFSAGGEGDEFSLGTRGATRAHRQRGKRYSTVDLPRRRGKVGKAGSKRSHCVLHTGAVTCDDATRDWERGAREACQEGGVLGREQGMVEHIIAAQKLA